MEKILLLYDHVLNVGGVESHLLGLIQHASRPSRFVFVSPVVEGFRKKAESFGAVVIPWSETGPLHLPTLIRLIRLLREEKPDLVHIHGSIAAVWGRIAARWCGVPCVVTVHLPAAAYHGQRQTLRARAGRALYTRLDSWLNRHLTSRLIFVSGQVRDAMIAARMASPENAEVIPNGIDLSLFDRPADGLKIRQEMSVSPGEVILCFAGRLDLQKGVDVLLDALALLADQQLPYRLWLAGDGPERDHLEEQAAALHLAGRVRFLGYRGDIPGLLNASDVFVMPSRYEAMPLALLEAFAAGLPCIVTDAGETAQIAVDQVSALVVKIERPDLLAEAVSALILHPEMRARLGQAARNRAKDFSLTKMVAETETVYSQVLSLRRTP